MTPVSPVFTEPTPEVVFAKNQPGYIPLPAAIVNGLVTTKWRLTWSERFSLLFGGHLWLQILTFGNQLQPVMLSVKEPTTDQERNTNG